MRGEIVPDHPRQFLRGRQRLGRALKHLLLTRFQQSDTLGHLARIGVIHIQPRRGIKGRNPR